MRTMVSRRRAARPLVALCALAIAACATTGGLGGPATTGSAGAAGPLNPDGLATAPGWRVNTREDVDLWLHGFALLTSDTGRVPFFARNYKQHITAIKRQKNLLTALDANQPQLS